MKISIDDLRNSGIPYRIMGSRSLLSRELSDVQVGEYLVVPFKYASISNIKKTVSGINARGEATFQYDNSGSEYSFIVRTA